MDELDAWMRSGGIATVDLARAAGLSVCTISRARHRAVSDRTCSAIERGMRAIDRKRISGDRAVVTCARCGRAWRIRNSEVPPVVCRWCRSKYWDKPKQFKQHDGERRHG